MSVTVKSHTPHQRQSKSLSCACQGTKRPSKTWSTLAACQPSLRSKQLKVKFAKFLLHSKKLVVLCRDSGIEVIQLSQCRLISCLQGRNLRLRSSKRIIVPQQISEHITRQPDLTAVKTCRSSRPHSHVKCEDMLKSSRRCWPITSILQETCCRLC